MIMHAKVLVPLLLALSAGCAPNDRSPAADRAADDAAAPATTPAAAAGGNGHAAIPATDRETVLFVGTSLTAGYGLGEEFAYPALLQRRMADAGLPFRVVNAGISGETSAGGLRRIDWMLQQPVGVLVLELGANDGLRGLDPDALRGNLETIIRRTRDAHPDAEIVLVGMEAPPNLGAAYTSRFRAVYAELAREYDAALVPFLLEGVAAEPALNLADGIHPNEEGQRRVADTVWQVLEPVLEQRAARRAASPVG
jgi:acyl-CoA thioesterase I